MPVIEVGTPAIDRPSSFIAGWNYIVKENPATASGNLAHVAMWWETAPGTIFLATYYQNSPNHFTTRDWCQVDGVGAGYSEVDVDLIIQAGDYLGVYAAAGTLSRTTSGEGVWYTTQNDTNVTDKLFALWANNTASLYGWTEVPPVYYSHFRIQDIAYTQGCHAVTVLTHTDVKCHKYLRFTDKSPRKHPRTLLRRGLLTQYDLRQCFVAYHDIEQEEPGDTLQHTFILENLIFCHGYFFYFWAKSGGNVMVYTSAIFAFYYPLGLPPYLTCERQELAITNTGYAQHWNALSQTFQVTHDYKVHHLSLMLNQFSTLRRGGYCVKITRDIPPCWNEPLLAIDYGSSLGLPAPGVKQWKSWWGIRPTLEVGKTYRIVVHTVPGWESYNGEEWVEDEACAALQWWISDNSDPYAYGSAYYGCNIQAQSASWQRLVDFDATFRLYQLCPSLPS